LKYFSALSLLLLLLCVTISASAQSTDAAISGVVVDPAGKVITDAEVEIVNDATGVHYSSKTNGAGIYSVTILPPGQYRLQVSKIGFKTLIKPGIILNVQSAVALNFTLPIGATSESITVEAGASEINTTNATVSTVIDSRFVENTPLNGRSFQGLILLTPGAVTNSPQAASASGATGEFSINGQRTESNYYTVDGVSANTGIFTNQNAAGPGGSLPPSTVLGTTQALVSVDALQEFRVQSSTYSAEYGRSPGGQFSMLTRSGSNDWRGTLYDYFRNDVFDANNWFNDNTDPITKKTPERQNDFGGTLGGPLVIPHLYDGKDRTFFFLSYEGLRLVLPQEATVNYVPDLALRQSTPGALQQVLNAFPLPTPGTPDLGNGLGEFIGGWSNPSQADVTSVRFDHSLGKHAHLFFRFSDTPSSGAGRGTTALDSSPSTITSTSDLSRTSTLGATINIARNTDNDFRLNYSSDTIQSHSLQDGIGGAVPVNLPQLESVPDNAFVSVGLFLGAYSPRINSTSVFGEQRQWNLVDTMSLERSRHAIKVGIDWRRLSPIIRPASPTVASYYLSDASVVANTIDIGEVNVSSSFYPLYTNFSLFGQDEWRVMPRLTLSMGVRWDINPAPGAYRGLLPYTVTGLNDPSTMAIAPDGTSLWKTGWLNFAPRLGVSYLLNANSERETVIRAGGGVFFDTGGQTGSYGFSGPGFQADNFVGTIFSQPESFPLPVAELTPTILQPPAGAPYDAIYANPPHFQLPYTLQWNVSLEQALGRSQSVTLSYVGANGRKLIEQQFADIASLNPNFTYLYTFTNGLTSSYNALQAKFQRRLAKGVQVLGSYTWSHSLDYGSYNTAFPYQRGNSDFDVRNNATAAVSYDFPHAKGSPWQRILKSGWGLDGRFTGRSGFPVTLDGNGAFEPGTLIYAYSGLDRVPETPLFLYGPHSTYPGGRRINPTAFALPPAGQAGDAPRNFVRGFGALQADIAIRRAFHIGEKVQGQFRAEAFNVANHPNFGLINSTYGNAQFGLATQTLSESLGTLSPLYQMGGPRSLQLTFRLTY
jgi:Carboxypeptidase regulatory-like domain/TonB dependent receptor